MADVTIKPSAWANVLTGKSDSTPIWLSHLLEAQTAITLAPAVGGGRLVFADPDGKWAATFKPNDILRMVFASRKRQALAQHGATPSWTGLVDRCYALYDPRAPYGRACVIEASTFWKALLITSVPFWRISKPRGGLTSVQLINMALSDVKDNIGLALNFSAVPSLAQQVPFWTVPSFADFMAPELTSWASYLTANALMAGNELFFNEAGDLILQATQFARSNRPDVTLNKEDLHKLEAGVTDDGLVTDVVVTQSMVPTLAGAGIAPGPWSGGPGGMDAAGNWDIGPMPAALRGPDGKALPRIGKRFQAIYVPWLQDQTAAARYAAIIRTIGLASVNQGLATTILDGDTTVGQLVQTAVDPAMRYYQTSVQHQWMMGQDASTQRTLRYGIAAGQSWDRQDLASYSTAGLPIPPTSDTMAPAMASLPALGNNPSVVIDGPFLTYPDIQTILAAKGSPFTDQAQLIWQLSQQTQIDPAFALAVWQAETGLGTAGVGRPDQDKNPGAVKGRAAAQGEDAAGFSVYGDYATAIKDWYALLAGKDPPYVGAGVTTVDAIWQEYAPPSDGNPDWGPDVVANMAQFRNNYLSAANGVIAQARATIGGTTTKVAYGTATAIAGSKRATLVALGTKQLGVPYAWGGETPGVNFDCSGLMQWLYSQVGVPIPRVAQSQHDYCQQIDPSQLQPGDLLFFTATDQNDAATVTHVGMWVGGNRMIDASGAVLAGGALAPVEYDTPFDGGYWEGHYYSAGRVPGID